MELTQVLYIRIPDALHARLRKLAESERRTLTAQTILLLEKAMPPEPVDRILREPRP